MCWVWQYTILLAYMYTGYLFHCTKMCKIWPCNILFYIFYLCKHEHGITMYNFVIFYFLLWKTSMLCSCTFSLFKVIFTCTRRVGMWPCAIWPTVDVHRPKKIISWVTAKHQHWGKISPTSFSYVNPSIGWITYWSALLSWNINCFLVNIFNRNLKLCLANRQKYIYLPVHIGSVSQVPFSRHRMVVNPERVNPILHLYVAKSPTLAPVALISIPLCIAGGVLQYVTVITKSQLRTIFYIYLPLFKSNFYIFNENVFV